MTDLPHQEEVEQEVRRRLLVPGRGPVLLAFWPNEVGEPLKVVDADSLFADEDRLAQFRPWLACPPGRSADAAFDAGLIACHHLANQSGAEIVIMASGFSRHLCLTRHRALLLRAVSTQHRLTLISTGDPRYNLDRLNRLKPLFSGPLIERSPNPGG